MNYKKILDIMGAGIGFQFSSGIKQFAKVDLNEKIVIDYLIYRNIF